MTRKILLEFFKTVLQYCSSPHHPPTHPPTHTHLLQSKKVSRHTLTIQPPRFTTIKNCTSCLRFQQRTYRYLFNYVSLRIRVTYRLRFHQFKKELLRFMHILVYDSLRFLNVCYGFDMLLLGICYASLRFVMFYNGPSHGGFGLHDSQAILKVIT